MTQSIPAFNVGGTRCLIPWDLVAKIGIIADRVKKIDEKDAFNDNGDTQEKSGSLGSLIHTSIDTNGLLYVDESPEIFKLLMSFLRDGQIELFYLEAHITYAQFLNLLLLYRVDVKVGRCYHCLVIYDLSRADTLTCRRHRMKITSRKGVLAWPCCWAVVVNTDLSGRVRPAHGCTLDRHINDDERCMRITNDPSKDLSSSGLLAMWANNDKLNHYDHIDGD